MTKFGKDFIWGVATASYQIEGARNEDGKSDSIWDTFTHKSGTVVDGSNADIACDCYHRLDEDLKLLEELGVKAYRFSVSWSRILPNGTGKINEKGVEYYNRLINGLLERNIIPYLTLYHWDLPQVLQDLGGFSNKEFPQWFLEYTKVVVSKFGDRVKHFFTFNEPQCIFNNAFAPGIQYTLKEQLVRVHNMLLAHGLSAKEIHKIPGAKVGYASCGMIPIPLTDSSEDYEVSKKLFFSINKGNPVDSTTLYADPIFFGKYPDDYYEMFKDILPEIGENDMEIISEPLDFWAQNTYDGYYCKAKQQDDGTLIAEGVERDWGTVKTSMGWHITPKSIYYAVKYVYERYNKPVYISENGISLQDFVFSDGKVHDPAREEYLLTYLEELGKAQKDGVKIEGYFYWSFLDNFEWMLGYTQRFGLVHVEYKTLKRTKKDSFYAYQKIIKEN